LEVTDDAKKHENDTRTGVIHHGILDSCLYIVLDGGTVPPLQDIGSEAVIGKSFGRICENITTELEVDVVSLGTGTS